MEFLMTYGWAILIVIVAIGALFFLGVFSGSAPNACTIGAPFNCIDTLGSDTANTIKLQVGSLNSVADITQADITGRDITVTGVTCASITTSKDPWIGGQKTELTCTGVTLVAGEKYAGEITIKYDQKNGLPDKIAEGTFSGTMQ